MSGIKTISQDEEARMQDLAKDAVEILAGMYPHAREIDLLNVYLRVFTERITPPGGDTE